MTKDEWRKLDKEPGMSFRLIADGRIGRLLRCHKDAAVLLFRIEGKSKGLYIREEEKYCPCEMLHLPDVPWKKQKEPAPANRKKYCSYERVCQYCGKRFMATHKTAHFCSQKCYGKYQTEEAKRKRDACKPDNLEAIVKWRIARGITAQVGADLCHVSLTTFRHWVQEYKEERGSGDAE